MKIFLMKLTTFILILMNPYLTICTTVQNWCRLPSATRHDTSWSHNGKRNNTLQPPTLRESNKWLEKKWPEPSVLCVMSCLLCVMSCVLCLVCVVSFFFLDAGLKKVCSHPPRQTDKLTSEPVLPHHFVCRGTFSVRGTGRRSRSDSAKALTTLHANIKLHRRNHAALAFSWRIKGTASTRAFANLRKNWAVSVDHLPPTSAAKMTRRALPSVPRASSGQVPSCAWPPPKRPHCGLPLLVWQNHLLAEGHKCHVYGKLRTLPQGQTVRNHLHPSIVECVELTKARSALQRETTRPQHYHP